MARKRISAVHPGAYLKELLNELTLSQARIARDVGVQATRIHKCREWQTSCQRRTCLAFGKVF